MSTTDPPEAPPRSTAEPAAEPSGRRGGSRSVADMLRSLVVVGAIVAVMIVLNYRAPDDPVKDIDPYPLAVHVASVAPVPVLVPTDQGWRPTAARWEPTQGSKTIPVWYVGGAYGADGPFASLAQSGADSANYIAEQTGNANEAGTATIEGQVWQRYEANSERSLVLLEPAGSTVVRGTGDWQEVERFAASLQAVAPTSG